MLIYIIFLYKRQLEINIEKYFTDLRLQIFLLYKSSNNWYHARYEHALQQVNMQHIERINTNRIYGINLITYFERIILAHGTILMNAARSLYNV